jgi:hypothetical protein
MKKLHFFVISILLPLSLIAQQQPLPPYELIDLPTAGTLPRGSYVSSLRLYPSGGVLGGVQVGLSDRLSFGVSFGGENIIGEGKINWNPEPGLQFVYRLIDENIVLPAITLGYNSQGYGAYLKNNEQYTIKRYTIKSRGIYGVASKNYAFLGDLSFHGGINYSFEREDGDKDLNLFAGIIKSLNRDLSLLAEYDVAVNDNNFRSIGSGKGYLNAGVRWLFANRLLLQFQFKNILENKERVPYSNREIKIAYIEYF